MEKSRVKNLSIWGAVFAIILGSLIHFFYGWSGNNTIVGLFAPINESPWEHMKLVFTPFVLFAFIDYFYLRAITKNYCFALLKEVGVAIAFILAVFYLYTSFAGHSILAVDISSFVIGIVLAKWLGYKILIGEYKSWEFTGLNTISAILLALVAAFFVYVTFNPPHTNLFLDETTSTYGIYENH